MADERRRTPRITLQTAVRVEAPRGLSRFKSLNISSGGIFLETNSPLPEGTRVQLRFDLPGHGQVDAEGVVKHVGTQVFDDPQGGEKKIMGMGIAFVRIAGDAAQALADKVKELTLKDL